MPKIILIITLAFSGLFVDNEDNLLNSKKLPVIEFSNSAIDFESGQPVFSKKTNAILNVQGGGSVRVIINDAVDAKVTKKQINLSSLIEFSEGTYTVVVKGEDFEEAFGFTIR